VITAKQVLERLREHLVGVNNWVEETQPTRKAGELSEKFLPGFVADHAKESLAELDVLW